MRKADQKRPYPPDFVSAATLAYRLDCSERAINDYVKEKLLPAPVFIGRLVRWFWPDVLDHIALKNNFATCRLEDTEGGYDNDADEYEKDVERAREAARKKTSNRAA